MAALCFMTIIYSLIEPYLIREKTIEFVNKDIPKALTKMKIVFITDIHHGPYFSEKRVESLVKRINKMEPDMILFGGDFIEDGTDYIESCFRQLKKLEATYGKYGVLGNHDYWGDHEMVREGMKNAGIEVMDNKSQWIEVGGDKIKLGGVGDLYEDVQYLEPTIEDVEEKDFVLLLSHNPDYVEEIKTKKIDFVLSGHNHGGQVTIFGLWAPLIPSLYGQKYRSGFVKTNSTQVYISRGVGLNALPIRFFAPPEITIVKLKDK